MKTIVTVVFDGDIDFQYEDIGDMEDYKWLVEILARKKVDFNVEFTIYDRPSEVVKNEDS